MEESGQNPVILPPQVVEKPTSVTVFGVLSCVFGGLGAICMPFALIGIAVGSKQLTMSEQMKMWTLVSLIVRFGLSVWLLILGIGLLTMKRWARSGAVFYSGVFIVWTIITLGMNYVALTLEWITIPKEALPGFIGGICGAIISLIYPILLMVFMKSDKVRQAFEVMGR